MKINVTKKRARKGKIELKEEVNVEMKEMKIKTNVNKKRKRRGGEAVGE